MKIVLWDVDSFLKDWDQSGPYIKINHDRRYFLQNIDRILLGALLCEQTNIIINDFSRRDIKNPKEIYSFAEQCKEILEESDIFKDAVIFTNWSWPKGEYEDAYVSFEIEYFNPMGALKGY